MPRERASMPRFYLEALSTHGEFVTLQ